MYTKDNQEYTQCSHCEDHVKVTNGAAARALANTKEECVQKKFKGLIGSDSTEESNGHWKFFNLLSVTSQQNTGKTGSTGVNKPSILISWTNSKDVDIELTNVVSLEFTTFYGGSDAEDASIPRVDGDSVIPGRFDIKLYNNANQKLF